MTDCFRLLIKRIANQPHFKGDAKSVSHGTEINWRARPKLCYFIFVDLLYNSTLTVRRCDGEWYHLFLIFAVFDVSLIACSRWQVYKLMFCTFIWIYPWISTDSLWIWIWIWMENFISTASLCICGTCCRCGTEIEWFRHLVARPQHSRWQCRGSDALTPICNIDTNVLSCVGK